MPLCIACLGSDEDINTTTTTSYSSGFRFTTQDIFKSVLDFPGRYSD